MTLAKASLHVLPLCLLSALWLVGTAAHAADTPGQKIYTRVCGECHGTPTEGGRGPALIPLPRSIDQIEEVVRYGTGEMKALAKSSISDEELAILIGYLRALDKK